jgi:hypothetical protein
MIPPTAFRHAARAAPAKVVAVIFDRWAKMMFNVMHTTPEKALSYLRRLQKEGEGLLGEAEVGARAEARWSNRVFKYLKKIAADPDTFERLMWHNVFTLPPPEEYRPRRTIEEIIKAQRKEVQKTLVTLAGAIEQFEAQYEIES